MTRRLLREMLGVPVGFQVGVYLGIYHEHPRGALVHPGPRWFEIVEGPDGARTRAVATRDGGEVGVRKLHDVDGMATTSVEVHLRRVRAVVVDEDAHSQLQADSSLEIGERHQETAVAGAEHGQNPGIRNCQTDRRAETKTDRLEGMAEA